MNRQWTTEQIQISSNVKNNSNGIPVDANQNSGGPRQFLERLSKLLRMILHCSQEWGKGCSLTLPMECTLMQTVLGVVIREHISKL